MRDGFIEDFQIWSPSEEIISHPATAGRPGDVGWCLQTFERTPFIQVRIAFRDILQYLFLFSTATLEIYEPRHEVSNNVICATNKASSFRSACAYALSDHSLCYLPECSINVKLLTACHLEFLLLKGGYTGSSESTHAKMPHCREPIRVNP